MLAYRIIHSPLGKITLQASQSGLTGLWFDIQKTQPAELGSNETQHPLLDLASTQLAEYFAGQRQRFNLPLAASGTPFQQRVWAALGQIPYGETCSYQTLAAAIGNPKAVRAVGLANGANPIGLIVPCHRVIGKNGRLTGYAGGLANKAWLLDFESHHHALRQPQH